MLVGYRAEFCWIHEQTGIMNVLLEWNSFIGRGLTEQRNVITPTAWPWDWDEGLLGPTTMAREELNSCP